MTGWWRRRAGRAGGGGDAAADAVRPAAFHDAAFLARLQHLTLRLAQAGKGGRLADQRTTARGQGTDFTDYRAYAPGDDLKAVDWNLYRRLAKLFVREFEERQAIPAYLLTDLSGSMFVETPPRIDAARRATLALAAILLAQQDEVRLFAFADALGDGTAPIVGRANIARVADLLAACAPGTGTALAASIDRLAAMPLRRGLVVVVSDFLDPAGIDAVAAALGRLRHRLLLVQIVRARDADPALDPALTGDVDLIDGEGGAAVRLDVTPAVIDRYRAGYDAFLRDLSALATARGAGLARIDADRDVIDQLAPLFGGGGRLTL